MKYLFPCVTFSQRKKTFQTAYIGPEFAVNTFEGDRAGLALGFNYGLNRHFALGAAFNAFIFNSVQKFGAAKFAVSYYPDGSNKKATVFASVEPGITIYSPGNARGNFAFDALIGPKLHFVKSAAAITLAAGFSSISIRNTISDKIQKFEGFKVRLGFGI